MEYDETRLFCPHIYLRPSHKNEFNLIPFQSHIECSQDLVNFVSFLVQEGYGCVESPGLDQSWVRRSLVAYAPLFVRTLTAIPLGLIPPSSHLMNIDRQIEGRLVAVDIMKDEAVFKLDSTSQRKLEVFYEEITGEVTELELTEKLDTVRVRMVMAEVIGIELVDFEVVFGDLFEFTTSMIEDSTESGIKKAIEDTLVRDEWMKLRQTLSGLGEGAFLPSDYEVNSDGEVSPDSNTSGFYSDDQLETFPEDHLLNPCTYWGSASPFLPDIRQSQFGHSGLSPESVELAVESGTLHLTTSEQHSGTIAQVRGAPKKYGNLKYSEPARAIHMPLTPLLVSLANPPSPPTFSLPTPIYAELSSTPPLGRTSVTSLSCMTSPLLFPNCEAKTEPNNNSDAYIPLTLEYQTHSRSTTSSPMNENEREENHSQGPNHFIYGANVCNPSVATFSPPSSLGSDKVYPLFDQSTPNFQGEHARGSIPIATITNLEGLHQKGITDIPQMSRCGSTSGQSYTKFQAELEVMSGYGYCEGGKGRYMPKQGKEPDLAEGIIHVRMKAMLDSAQSGGFIFKATMDGLDNHPISVRLRSLSSQQIAVQKLQEPGPIVAQNSVPEVRTYPHQGDVRLNDTLEKACAAHSGFEDAQGYECVSSHQRPPSTVTPFQRLQADAWSDMLNHLTSTPTVERMKRLRELREIFEREGEQILGSLRRTIERIQLLDDKIHGCEASNLISMRTASREMVELCGYNGSTYVHETTTGSFQTTLAARGGQNEVRCLNDTECKQYPYSYSNGVSQCCQYRGMMDKCFFPTRQIRCTHGMLRAVKPQAYSTSTIVTPAVSNNAWQLNYAVGVMSSKNSKRPIYQQLSVENTSVSAYPKLHPLQPYIGYMTPVSEISTSGADAQNPKRAAVNSPIENSSPEQLNCKPIPEQYTPARRTYLEKLIEYSRCNFEGRGSN